MAYNIYYPRMICQWESCPSQSSFLPNAAFYCIKTHKKRQRDSLFLLIEQGFRYIFYTGKYKKASMKGSFTHMVEVRGVEPLSKSSPTYKRLQLIPWWTIPVVNHGQSPPEGVWLRFEWQPQTIRHSNILLKWSSKMNTAEWEYSQEAANRYWLIRQHKQRHGFHRTRLLSLFLRLNRFGDSVATRLQFLSSVPLSKPVHPRRYWYYTIPRGKMQPKFVGVQDKRMNEWEGQKKGTRKLKKRGPGLKRREAPCW